MLCVKECVSGVWRIVDGRARPVEPGLCNLCSHCIAICPADAIFHEKLNSGPLFKLNKKKPDSKSYRETVMGRRSIRNYRNREVKRETIEDIIDLARYSPTASNKQDVRYIVVTNRELIRDTANKIFNIGAGIYRLFSKGPGRVIARITGLDKNRYIKLMGYYIEEAHGGRDYILHNAPALILIHSPRRQPFACDNCSLAAANIMNYAHSLGLGSCPIGFLTLALSYSRNLRKAFQVPKGRRVYASIAIGYPAYPFPKSVSRKKLDIIWL